MSVLFMSDLSVGELLRFRSGSELMLLVSFCSEDDGGFWALGSELKRFTVFDLWQLTKVF